ncbi:hypothetical protein DPEC_G00335340 [Dallia pectoralis]|uniref:Uncharacterized protein n=1 Tax=Dallia pectoralis TaxID=75939 RepID=A0ACC2F6X9_DALPE|nr:hypothetical protein DPEC_G00335340 [Dallia pectoralis]
MWLYSGKGEDEYDPLSFDPAAAGKVEREWLDVVGVISWYPLLGKLRARDAIGRKRNRADSYPGAVSFLKAEPKLLRERFFYERGRRYSPPSKEHEAFGSFRTPTMTSSEKQLSDCRQNSIGPVIVAEPNSRAAGLRHHNMFIFGQQTFTKIAALFSAFNLHN